MTTPAPTGRARRTETQSAPPPLTGFKATVYNAGDRFGSFLTRLFTKTGDFLTRNISDRINRIFHTRPEDLYQDRHSEAEARTPAPRAASAPAPHNFEHDSPAVEIRRVAARLAMARRPPTSPYDGLDT